MTDKLFTINEGEFYSKKNKFPKFIFRNKINFKVKFTLPPEYKLTTLNKQDTETNNILTISDSLNHLKNSAGIGYMAYLRLQLLVSNL